MYNKQVFSKVDIQNYLINKPKILVPVDFVLSYWKSKNWKTKAGKYISRIDVCVSIANSIYLSNNNKNKKSKKVRKEYLSNIIEDYSVVSSINYIPKNKKDWVEITRFDLQEKSNRYEHMVSEYLKNNGVKFITQAPFYINGKIYFLDFYIPNKKTAIEVDGSYHYGHEQLEHDKERDYNFIHIGIKTLRISNSMVSDKKQLDLFMRTHLIK